VKVKVYENYIKSCETYGSETWPLKVEHEFKLETTDMREIRRMCGVSLRDRVPSAQIRARIVVEPVSYVCSRNRLRWFGHVERKGDDDWERDVLGWR
jgi:hypothetical protein